MSDKPLTFQEIILTLDKYWAEQGCTVMQPYDSEVGAGTFHTATLLRSLGPAARPTAATATTPTACSTTTSSRCC